MAPFMKILKTRGGTSLEEFSFQYDQFEKSVRQQKWKSLFAQSKSSV